MADNRQLPSATAIRAMNASELEALVGSSLEWLGEDEAMAILSNRFCSSHLCLKIAQSPRLTSLYTVRKALVAHRQTPLASALKFVHYLYWSDLGRLSIDVRVPPQVRRAIDAQLVNRVAKLAVGEKIVIAKVCSREVGAVLLRDPDPKVFAAVLTNGRLSEDAVLAKITTRDCTPDQLRVIANDRKWSQRREVRKALVLNPETPRATAATQLRHLTKRDLFQLLRDPGVSLFLKRCIERLLERQPTDTQTLPSEV